MFKSSKEIKPKETKQPKSILNFNKHPKKFHVSDNEVLPRNDSKETTDNSAQVTTILLPDSSTSIEAFIKGNTTKRPDFVPSAKKSNESAITERSEILTLTSPIADVNGQVTESISVAPVTTTVRSRRPIVLGGPQGRHTKPKTRRRSKAIWGRWQPWTECSRSCGGGVMSQSRQCMDR